MAAASDAMALVDDIGFVQVVNAAFASQAGRPVEACSGFGLGMLLAALPGCAADVAARLAAALRTPGPQPRRFEIDLDAAPLVRVPPGEPPRHEGSPPRRSGRLPDNVEVSRPRLRLVLTQLEGSGPGVPAWLAVVSGWQQTHEQAQTLFDLARQANRIGIWERELPSGRGRWDAKMFRLYGLDPRTEAPSYEEVAALMYPEDSQNPAYRASTQQPGRYEHQLRFRTPDGTPGRAHAIWQVEADTAGRPARVFGIAIDDSEIWRQANAFREASTRLRTAVALGNIGVWRQTFASGQVQLNEIAWTVIGRPPNAEGLDRRALLALIHPEDMGALRASARVALEQDGPVDATCRYRSPDGRWREMLTRRVVERDAEGRPIGFIGIVLDVDEQSRRAREALELTRRFDFATRTAGIGVWSHVEGSAAEWNEQMWALIGLPPEATPPRLHGWVGRCVHPDDRRPLLKEAIGWLRDAGAPALDQEFRIVLPGGEVCWIASRARTEATPNGRRIGGVMLDITTLRAAQHALRDAYERAALTARGAGIATWERVAGSASSVWDDQMFRLRGLDPGVGALGEVECRALIHPEDAPRVEAVNARALEERQQVSYEFRVQMPDGSWRWLASRASPVFDRQGRIERVIGVNWDVTEAKNNEAERREKELALRENQAKSQLLARISHELRTPLNAVLGFTQLLQAEEDGSSPARAARLAHIRGGAEHLLSLIDEVLDLSSFESGQLRIDLAPVVVGSVLREALPMVQELARRHHVTIEAGNLDQAVALADPSRLRQVLINLLGNAIKYNRPFGRISVRGEVRDGHLLLHVSDTGRGMSAEQLSHLFEPFNRLGAEREGIEGTGIGLVIVRMLVERMGGRIAVRSEPGVGSVFELDLRTPQELDTSVTSQAPPAAPEAPDEPAPLTLGAGTLLYIEDNPVNTLLVRELIGQRPSLRLVCAEDGAAGVEQAQRLRPDLILVDMQLPDMDGHEVLRRLRAMPETAVTPCIALSANAMAEDIERALAAGFSDYWTKPIDLRRFVASIDALFKVPPAPAP